MNDYLIVTDSTSDLTPELVETLDITLIPMEFQVDEKSYYNYPDGREIGFSAFYNLLRQEKNATTAQINFIRYTEIFEPILKEGRDLLYICFSSGLSGSYNSALAAAQGLRESYPAVSYTHLDVYKRQASAFAIPSVIAGLSREPIERSISGSAREKA